MAGQDNVRRHAAQDIEGSKRLRGVLVQAGRHDLRTDPAGERIPGDQRVAGQEDPAPFDQKRCAARRVPRGMHGPRLARIDSKPDTAKIGSADRVEVHHAQLLAVIGV